MSIYLSDLTRVELPRSDDLGNAVFGSEGRESLQAELEGGVVDQLMSTGQLRTRLVSHRIENMEHPNAENEPDESGSSSVSRSEGRVPEEEGDGDEDD